MSKHKLNPKLSTEEMERTSSPIISYLNLHPVKPDTIRKKSEQNNVQSSKMLPVETESNPYLITNNLNGVPVVDINTMPKTKKSDKKQVQSRKLSAAKIESSSNSVINNQKLHPAELKKNIKLKELEKKDKTKHKTKPVQDTLEKNLSPTFKCKLKSFKFKAVKEQKNDNDERREQRSKTAQPKKSYKRESQTNSEQIKDVKKTRKFIKELNKVMMEVGKEQRNQIFQTVRHFVSESDIDKSTLKEVKVVENAVNDDGIRNNINKDQPAESIAATDTKSIKTKLKRGRPPIKKKKDVIGTGLEEATKISSTTGTSQRCSSSIAVDMVLEDVVNKCYVEDTEQDDELTQLLGPFQVDFVSEDGVNECYVGNAIEDKPSTQVLGLHPINFVTENRNKSPIANTDEDNQLAQPSGSLFVDSIPEDFVNKCYVTNTDKDEQLTQVACPLPVELIPEDVINKCYVENMDKDELLVQVSDPIHVGLVEGIMDKYYVANADENDSTQVPGLANTDEDEQVNHMDLVIENVVNKCYKTTKVSGPDHIGKRLKAVQSSPGVFEHSRKNSKIKNVRKEKIKVESHRKRKNKSNCNGPVKKRKKDKEISQTAYDLKDLKIVLEDVYLNQALVAKYLNSHLEDDEYSSTRKTLVNFSQKSNNAIDKTSDILHDDQFNLRNGICITIPKIDRFSSSINEFSLTRDMLNTLPDKSNLLVTRTLSNLSAEKEVNLSAEKEVNLSAENEVNLSAEKEVNLSAEKEVNLSAEKEVNLSAEKEVNLSAENEVNLSAEKEVNLSAEKEVNLSAEKEVNLSAEKEVNLSAEKEVNLSAENEVNLSAENEVNLSAEKEVNLSAEKEVNLSAEKEVNLSAEKEVNLSAEKEVNLSAEKEVNLSAEKEVNLSAEKEVNLSAEKEVNLSAEKEVNLSAEKEVNLSAEKEVNLSAEKEVNLSAEKEVNLSAEKEVNLSAEKEVNLSAEKEVNLSAEKEVNLSAEKEVNLSAEKEVNLSAEKEVNLSAEKEVNLSAEKEVNLSAEKEVNLSAEKEVNLSAEKEVNLSAEKEVNLSAENEVNLSAEKEVNLSAEKEVNLSAEKEVNLSAEKEVNLSAEKEVNLSAENEVNLSAENEVNLSAEKEVNLSAEKEVNLSAEKEVNLSAEKEVNLSAENEVNLSAENEVNLSAENEVNLSDESNKIFNNKNQLVVCKGLDISISKLNRFNRRYSFSSDSSQDEFSPAHDTVNILPDKSNRLTRTSLISNSENKVNLSDKSNVPLPQIFDNSLNRNFSSVEDRPNFNNLSNIGETSSSLVLNSSGNLCSTTNDQYNDRTNDRVSASKIWVPRITFNRNTDNRVVECSSLKNSGVFEDELYYSDEYEIDETYSNEEEMEFEFDPYLWNIKYKFSSEEKICIQSHDSIFKNATLSSKSNLDEFPFTTNILNEWLINHQTSQSKFRSPNLPPAKRPPRRLFQKSETSVSSREGSISNKLDKTLKPEPELNEDDTISLYAESITSHLFTSRKLNQLSPVKVISENAVQCEDTSFNKLSSVPLSDRSPAPQSVDSNENVESWINTNFNTNARGPWKCSVFMQLCYHFYFYKCKKRYCRYMHEMAKEVEDNILQLNLDDLMDAYNCTLKSMKLFNSTVQIFLKAFVNFKSVTSIVELGQDSLSRASDKRVILEKCISGLESIGIEFYDAVLKLTEYFETSILLSDILFDIIASQSPDKIVNNLEIVRKLLTNRQSWAVDYGVVSDIMSKSYISNNIELARFALLDILNCRRVDEKLIDVDIHRKFFELLTKHEVEDRDTYFNQLISLEILSWDTYEFIRPPNFEYNETGANTNSFNAAEVNLNNLNKSNSEDHLLDCANRSIDLEVRSNSSFKRCSKSPSEHSSKLIRSKCGILETASSDANLNKCDDDYDEENCLEYNSSNSSPTAVLAEDDVVRSQNLDLESNCNILLGSCAPLAEDELKILSKIINEGDYLGFTVKLHEIQDTPLIRSFVLNSICLFKQKEPADAYKMFISLFNGLKYLCDSPKGSSMRNILKMLTINMVIIFEHSKAYNEAARVLLQYRDKLDELTEVEWFKKINGCNLSKMGKLLYFCKVLLRGGYLRDCIDLFMDPNLKLMCQKNMWTIQNSGNYDVNFRNDVLREVLKKTIETDISLAKILILHLITEKNHISEIAIWKYFNNLLYAMMHKKEDVYREDIKGILDNILAGWYTHLSTLVLRGLVVVLVTHISESDALNLYSKCCKKSIYAKIKGDESTLTIRTDFSVEEIFLTIRYYFHKLIKTRCEGQDITLKLIIPDAIEAKLQLIINNDSILQFKHKIYGILAMSFPYTIFVKDNGAEPSIQIKFEQLQKCVDYYRKNKGCQ